MSPQTRCIVMNLLEDELYRHIEMLMKSTVGLHHIQIYKFIDIINAMKEFNEEFFYNSSTNDPIRLVPIYCSSVEKRRMELDETINKSFINF